MFFQQNGFQLNKVQSICRHLRGLLEPKQKSLAFCLECVYVLAGQLVHMQGHRAFLVALLVVLRHVHVALCVACVIRHPHSHRSACNSQLP